MKDFGVYGVMVFRGLEFGGVGFIGFRVSGAQIITHNYYFGGSFL